VRISQHAWIVERVLVVEATQLVGVVQTFGAVWIEKVQVAERAQAAADGPVQADVEHAHWQVHKPKGVWTLTSLHCLLEQLFVSGVLLVVSQGVRKGDCDATHLGTFSCHLMRPCCWHLAEPVFPT